MTAEQDPENGLPGELSGLADQDLGGIDLGGMDLGGLLESAQNAMAAQAEAASRTVEGTSGGGVVRITMSGAGEVTKVDLDPTVVDPGDVSMLEDLIVAALADAGRKVTALQQEAMGVFGQVGLSGAGDEGLGGLDGLMGDLPDQPEH